MDYSYKTKGTCSQLITFSLDENGIITECKFLGGCPGNLLGISKLVVGMHKDDVIAKVEGVRCGAKPTSCPDQLAQALKTVK